MSCDNTAHHRDAADLWKPQAVRRSAVPNRHDREGP
jgi:hypothetical protein